MNRSSRSRLPLVAALTALPLLAAPGLGQSQQIVIMEDDGSGPRVLHMTQPDYEALREPDYDRTDLPLMRDVLLLRDDQMTTVETLLDAYLAKLQALLSEQLPAPQEGQMVRMFGGDPAAPGEGPQFEVILGDALEDLGEGMDVDVDTDGQRTVSVRVGTWVTAPGPDGDGGGGGGDVGVEAGDAAPADMDVDADISVTAESSDEEGAGARVDIAMQGLDDADIPEELRAQLEEAAQKLVEQLQEQLETGEFDPEAAAMMTPDIDGRLAEHEAMLDAASRAAKEKEALTAAFVAGVQAELDDPQLERWPALDRALVRHKTLPRNRLDGEQTDLLAVLDEMDLTPDEREALLEVRMAYEMALHQALVERNAFVPEANRRVDELLASGAPDRALAVVDRATRLRVAVRDVNTVYAESMAETLPPVRETAFRDAVRRSSFPHVYGRTRGQRAFDAVLALPELDPTVRDDVKTLRMAYDGELALVNERLQRAIEKHQPEESRRGIEHVRDLMDGGDPSLGGMSMEDDPIAEAFGERRAFDERYIARLRGMLPPEALAALPALEPREEPMMIRRSLRPGR